MEDINAKRLEAIEWAIEAGHVITQDHRGFFIATGDEDSEPFAKHGSLRGLADELGRIRERIERKP